jgi:hypothetical protein
VGAWRSDRSLRRILRTGGLLPTRVTGEGARQATPDELVEMLGWLADHGKATSDLDVVVEGETEPGDSAPRRQWQEAGANWWLESRWMAPDSATVRRRIEAGPQALSTTSG